MPLNSFMLFSRDFRQSVKDSNPEATTTEIAKELGRIWRDLSDEKKQVYRDMVGT